MKRLIILGLLFWQLPAYADNCDQPKDDFDGLYCLNKVYLQADKDLNDTYKTLQAKLDPEGRKLLKTRQLGWIQKRNKQCSYHDQTGFFVNLQCATDTTVNQLQFLQERERECVSAGCMNSKLK